MHLATKPHFCTKRKSRMRNVCSPAVINSPDGTSCFWNWVAKNQCGLNTEHLSCPALCVATAAHSLTLPSLPSLQLLFW